jgi:hypothetical protein
MAGIAPVSAIGAAGIVTTVSVIAAGAAHGVDAAAALTLA